MPERPAPMLPRWAERLLPPLVVLLAVAAAIAAMAFLAPALAGAAERMYWVDYKTGAVEAHGVSIRLTAGGARRLARAPGRRLKATVLITTAGGTESRRQVKLVAKG